MKIKDNFMLRKVADTYVVVPVGAAVAEFNGMINLNETGAFLWKEFETDKTFEDVLKAMLEEYEVEENLAKKDLENFVNILKENNLIC